MGYSLFSLLWLFHILQPFLTVRSFGCRRRAILLYGNLPSPEACKHNLQGRVIWTKGSTLLIAPALKNKPTPLWKNLIRLGITSLGKGFYEISFSSLDDVKRVRASPFWNLDPGTLKLFPWTKDFNSNLQKVSTSQVWIQIFGLAQEYCRLNVLFTILSSVGMQICIDALDSKPRFDLPFDYFVRVLVYMNLSVKLRHNVLVKIQGYAFLVDIEYENLPQFCSHCKITRNFLHSCKNLKIFDVEKA